MKTILLILTSVALATVALIPSGAGEPRGEPNLLVDVSAALINAVVQRSVDQTEPVDDVIQDTPVHGIGRTVGMVRAELIPDRSNAAIDVIFGGCSWSRTFGTRANVFLYTFTTTPLEVRQRVLMDGAAIRTFTGPCYAESATQLLDIQSRTHPEALTIKFARRVFQNTQAAAEAETASKTAGRASARLQEELTPILASASQSVGRELKGLKTAGLPLESLDFDTTEAFLHGRLRFAAPGRGKPTRAPSLPPDIDLGVRIHETLANESSQAQLAGRSFLLRETSKIYDEITRGLLLDARPPGPKKGDLRKLEQTLADLAGKPVTITFAQKDPMTVVFGDQEVTVDLRFASIRQEKAVYVGPRLRVAYRLENSAKGVLAVRKGTVQVLPGEPSKDKKMQPLPEQFRILQEVLFVEVFKERFGLNPIPMPEALAQVRLNAPNVYARNGWLGVVWKLGR